MANSTNTKRGFAAMDADTRRKIASKGGKASSGSFASGSSKASNAGQKGARAQPTEAKAKGAKRSNSNK